MGDRYRLHCSLNWTLANIRLEYFDGWFETAHRCARASNGWGTGRLGALQNAPTNPTLECKDDRFSRFSFPASHYHFSMTVWAPRQGATKRGDELIFGDGGCFIHGAIVVSSYFEMFKNKSSVPEVGMKADLRKRSGARSASTEMRPLLG